MRLLSRFRGGKAEAPSLVGEEERGDARGLSEQIRIGAPDGRANFVLPRIVALLRVVSLSRREADMAITVSARNAGRLTSWKVTDFRLHLAQ